MATGTDETATTIGDKYMSNESIFAIAYRRASSDMMEAVAAQSPSRWLDSALRNAHRALCGADNIIEESLANSLIDAIEKTSCYLTV